MREPFVKLYGMEYFQTQWSNWVNAYGQYMEQRKGSVQEFLLPLHLSMKESDVQ